MSHKLRIRLPDGRQKLCGCGTRSRERYDAMRQWVQTLRRGTARRADLADSINVLARAAIAKATGEKG